MSEFIYYFSLLVCVSLGSYYKKITDIDMKRNYGTGLGLLLVCLISGHQVYHSALMVWGNIIIIKCCDRRYLHQISLAFTWIYLLYLHLNVTNIYIIWLNQTLALKLVGLAFEMNAVQIRTDAKGISVSKINIRDVDSIPPEPSAADIIAYSYYFIGLHRGPYYRWKIFDDHFNAPFGVLGDCRIITEQKLKKAIVCGLGYLLLRSKYSPELYYEDVFYNIYGADFRYLYNIPQLTMYFLHWQTVMMLCTSVFTEAGFGVYPAKCQPIPGFGPSTHLSFVTLATTSTDVALEEEYNFSMLKCFNIEGLLIGPKMKDTMRSWDMPTRYWFWAYVQKTFIKSNKEVRSAFSLLVWTLWSGPTLPQFIIASTLWVYVHLEAEYSVLYDTSGALKLPWDIGFSIMRMFCLLYLTPCFVIKSTDTVLRYYNSIFWVFHLLLIVLMIYSVIVYKTRSAYE
ncbi:lysophospholipid acyltransferase 7-like isoform X1 [Nymphalis io]|uniref:lysophospholipid acyltransferase 7-like isoform X1 n=1 Tax=Inachis io TaxID=171585 RepID=UPI002167C367|nr:lysophospholipid acyltransferase 7-like isoform X1 [Nymphalis io]